MGYGIILIEPNATILQKIRLDRMATPLGTSGLSGLATLEFLSQNVPFIILAAVHAFLFFNILYTNI